MERFTGTVKKLCDCRCAELADLVDWLDTVPLEEWPQQVTVGVKPAMVSNLAWRGLGDAAWPLVRRLGFDGNDTYQHMVSVVMPGDRIELHRDQQADYWAARVHVPLVTNPKSWFMMDKRYKMRPGEAYLVNVLDYHGVVNDGRTPRVHFMFDVRQ